MAEGQDEDRQRDDLSEEASPHKVEEYRRKGKVAQSRELSGLIGLLAGIGFTMSLFINELAFLGIEGELRDELVASGKIGIFIASIVSAVVGLVLLKITCRTDKDRIAALLPSGIEPGDAPSKTSRSTTHRFRRRLSTASS